MGKQWKQGGSAGVYSVIFGGIKMACGVCGACRPEIDK